jgi:protein-S-isoprenylcysteine O-methyltransferase Ste14
MAIVEQDLQVAAAPGGRLVRRLLDLFEKVLLVGAFAFYIAANLASHIPVNTIVASADAVSVWCVLTRRQSDSVSLSPYDWTLAIVGTMGVMLARPGGHALIGPVIAGVMGGSGLLISVAAKLSLNRSFGVGPANRGVKVGGAYAFVRHPMYFGYILISATYLLLNPTAFNVSVYAMTWMCNFGRIAREENWLMRDPAYRAYARTVRFRLVPGII